MLATSLVMGILQVLLSESVACLSLGMLACLVPQCPCVQPQHADQRGLAAHAHARQKAGSALDGTARTFRQAALHAAACCLLNQVVNWVDIGSEGSLPVRGLWTKLYMPVQHSQPC